MNTRRKSKRPRKHGRKTRSKRQRGGNQEEKDNYLFDAIDMDDADKVDRALNNGADKNAIYKPYGWPALYWATHKENTEMVSILLEKGAEVNAKNSGGSTALIKASLNGHAEVVRMLLNNGADVNVKDDTGTTALFSAILYRHTEVVRILLENGADVHVKTMYGSTTLDMASWDGDIEIVAMLLENGADVNAKSTTGSTALMKASLNGHTEVVRMLLEKGADVNVKDDNGSTALMKAILNGHTEVVRMLLEKGADINKKNNDGETPLMRAIRIEDYDMVELLLEYPDIDIELDVDTNKELRLAEELTPEDEEQNGIPYLIEDYIVTKNKIKDHKYKNLEELSNYKRPNVSSLKTKAYHQSPTDVDTIYNLQLLGMNRPYGKLGGKRKTRKSKKSNKRFRTSRKKK